MFGNTKGRAEVKDDKANDKVDTIIGAGTTFVGELQVKGTLRVDGRCEGKITSSGDVVVGEAGLVVSTIQARNLQASGTIKGHVKATGVLEITATGKLYGDIEVGKLMISDGAVFQGQCKMHSGEVDAVKAEKKE